MEEKGKKFNKKKTITILATLLVVFIAANVYAATNGYNNVFFMIRDLATGKGGHAEKDEILIDRDITISYSNIRLSDDLSIQINKLQIKDDEAKLFISVTEHTGKNYISKVIVRDNANGKILSDDIFATKPVSDGSENIRQEAIILTGMTKSTNEITLELFDKSNDALAKLLINLDKREIDILSSSAADDQVTKLSEIELKEEFGRLIYSIPELGGEVDPIAAAKISKLRTSMHLVQARGEKPYTTSVLKAYNEIFGEDVLDPEDLLVPSDDWLSIKNGMFEELPNDANDSVVVLDIQNLVYDAGMYTANFIYVMPVDAEEIPMEDLPQFFTSIEFTLNPNYKYSKYRIENYDQLAHNEYSTPEHSIATTNTTSSTQDIYTNTNTNTTTNTTTTTSHNTVSTVPSTPNTNSNTTTNSNTQYDISKIDNYASTMSWSDYWSPGLRLSYPSIFSLKEEGEMRGSSQGSLATVISGLALGIDRETNTPIESDMTIEIYEPEILPYSDESQVNNYIHELSGKVITGAGLTNNLDDFWALAINENDPESSDEYYHTEPLSDGGCVLYRIVIASTNKENFKVINIVNRFLGSLTPTSY